jgi:aryl-alcohol dehydrogenase-like predicted oxidoreductase
VHRRRALHALGALALASVGPPRGPLPGAPKPGSIPLPPGGAVPRRALGSTGVTVSAIGLGGYHLGIPNDPAEAVRIVHEAMDHGVDFLDNCWDYNGGESERRVGLALEGGRRARAFVMTKLDGRTKAAAAGQLDQSLRRLRTDVIDLVQIHEVIRSTDPDRVFSAGGAIEALLEAKQAGKVRFLGFTGHKDPAIHLAMLRAADAHGVRFDAVQLPLNPMDPHYRSFERLVVPELVKRNLAVLGMKPLGSGLLLQSKAVTAPECLRYALGLPTSVVITGCDGAGVLEQALAAAMTFQPMSAEERDALLARTARPGAHGEHEAYKTGDGFDGTAKNPRWLEGADL